MLAFRDDLSCGPIEPEDASVRVTWWRQFYDEFEEYAEMTAFWDRATWTDDRLVVWFSRHSARELAFFLAWTDRLGERPYQVIDVTGRQLPLRQPDGTVVSKSLQAVSIIPRYALESLLGTEAPISAETQHSSRQDWQRLRGENAPFRIASETGLVSAPIDCFDALLLAQASSEWRSVARVIGNTMGFDSEPYMQVGDLMLLARVVALVEGGKLVADGDPWKMASKVRLPASP